MLDSTLGLHDIAAAAILGRVLGLSGIDAYLDEHEELPPAAAYTDCTAEVDNGLHFFDCASYPRDDHPMYYFDCDEGNSYSEGDWFLRLHGLRVSQEDIDCVFESPEEMIADFEGDMALQLYITQTRLGIAAMMTVDAVFQGASAYVSIASAAHSSSLILAPVLPSADTRTTLLD
jgi:hypothetical protein